MQLMSANSFKNHQQLTGNENKELIQQIIAQHVQSVLHPVASPAFIH